MVNEILKANKQQQQRNDNWLSHPFRNLSLIQLITEKGGI